MQTKLLLLPAALVLISCSGPAVSSRPCPQVTQHSPALMLHAAEELAAPPDKPALRAVLDAEARDRGFNREVCR